MPYVGPCSVCHRTIGESEKRVYIGEGKKVHPDCLGLPESVVSNDAPWSTAETSSSLEDMQATRDLVQQHSVTLAEPKKRSHKKKTVDSNEPAVLATPKRSHKKKTIDVVSDSTSPSPVPDPVAGPAESYR